jgi:hypothetical protein
MNATTVTDLFARDGITVYDLHDYHFTCSGKITPSVASSWVN